MLAVIYDEKQGARRVDLVSTFSEKNPVDLCALPLIDERCLMAVRRPERRRGWRKSVDRREHPRYLSEDMIVGKRNISIKERSLQLWDGVLKRTFDVLFAIAFLTFALPLLLFVCVAVKVDGGPIFYSQERVGLGGRRFRMFKFRSMVRNADQLKAALQQHNEMGGPAFKMKDDPRVTKVGRYLRKYSIDELPQFWNVLRGEMSVVGPRPVLPKEVEGYREWQLARFSVKPGLTCLWQVSGRSRIGFDDWMRMDIRYIRSQGFACDMGLVLRTVKVVVKGDGAW